MSVASIRCLCFRFELDAFYFIWVMQCINLSTLVRFATHKFQFYYHISQFSINFHHLHLLPTTITTTISTHHHYYFRISSADVSPHQHPWPRHLPQVTRESVRKFSALLRSQEQTFFGQARCRTRAWPKGMGCWWWLSMVLGGFLVVEFMINHGDNLGIVWDSMG